MTYFDLGWPVLLAQEGGTGFGSMVPALAMIMVLFYFMLIRPERNKQKAHKQLLESLKKNDRVLTVGGIYGVVTNVQRGSDEVTIKVDEATNTKLRITFNSITRVIRNESNGDNSGKR